MISKLRTLAIAAVFAGLAAASQGGLMTFNSGAGPAVPNGLDLSGTNPGAAVISQILIPGGNNFTINPGNAATVTLTNWSHTFINDLVITLTGPVGPAKTMLSRQDGGCNFVASSAYSFNSSSSTPIPACSSLPADTYLTFDPTFSAAWAGVNINNTTWTLTVQDFVAQDVQGAGWTWSLTLDVDSPSGVPEPATVVTMLGGLLGIAAFAYRRRRA